MQVLPWFFLRPQIAVCPLKRMRVLAKYQVADFRQIHFLEARSPWKGSFLVGSVNVVDCERSLFCTKIDERVRSFIHEAKLWAASCAGASIRGFAARILLHYIAIAHRFPSKRETPPSRNTWNWEVIVLTLVLLLFPRPSQQTPPWLIWISGILNSIGDAGAAF